MIPRQSGILILLLVIGATLLVLDHGTQAQTPDQSEPPATPTATAAATPAPSGTILAADNFSDPNTGILPKSAANPDCCKRGYLGGEYQLAKIAPTSMLFPAAPLPDAFTDGTVDVDVRVASASGGSSGVFLGVRCRSTGPMNYSFNIYPFLGTFALVRYDVPGNFTNLIGGFPQSAAIQQGTGSNHLRLTCNGNTITASINGTQVASVQDSAYQSGQVFLQAGVLSSYLPGTVDARFSNLVVTQP